MPTARPTTVRTGLERLLAEERWRIRRQRVGLLVNQTSVDAALRPSLLTLAAAADLTVAAVFSPEHGLWGTHQDMEGVPSGRDPLSGLPVRSLYGADEASLAPAVAALRDLEVLVFDVQDVGARYYTFVYSLLHAMAVAAELPDLRVVVCDRPNPLTGEAVEGNLVQPGYESFVGRWALPNRHGLTCGELARLFATRHPCRLEVVPMEGWRRAQWFDETGLPWVAPSPNMPTLDTAAVYPGMCLLEGTNLSEGRGTTRPFELFGAPWLDARAFAERLAAARLPGVRFRPTLFRPTFQKHAGVVCGGAQVHVVDRAALRPVELGLTVLAAARDLAPAHFRWRADAYEFVTDRPAIDLLAGSDTWRRGLEAGASPAELLAAAAPERAEFVATAQRVRLYD
jgi:uncharacterized protein YbbC (DUF1343 family)